MQTHAPPIPFSADDLERRRLEHTIDHDLSSLSFTASTSFASGSSLSTIPVARSAHVSRPMSPLSPPYRFPGADDTPRASKRAAASFARTNDFSEGIGLSPGSTAGHHVSAATLGAGVFQRPPTSFRNRTGEEFDPDRSLGRLVSELNKAKDEERFPPKPASPFAAPRSPHSPSPASSALPNLSFQLTRSELPLSPPHSRTVSSSSSGSQQKHSISSDQRVTNGYAAANGTLPTSTHGSRRSRTALGETGRHNRAPPPPHIPGMKDKLFKAPTIVPVVHNNSRLTVNPNLTSADITGLTGLLATPAKGATFEDLNKNGADAGTAGQTAAQALATMQARIRALETENGVSRRRIRELEAEVERAREEVASASRIQDERYQEVLGEKTALEELVAALREKLRLLTLELEQKNALIAELQQRRADETVIRYLERLSKDVEHLTVEVTKANRIAETGLEQRTRSREQRSVRINALDLHDQDEVDRVRADVDRRVADFSGDVTRDIRQAAKDATVRETSVRETSARDTRDATALPSQLRQGLHTAAATQPTLMPPSAGPPSRVAEQAQVNPHVTIHPSSPSPPSRSRTINPPSVASPAHSLQSLRSQKSTSTTSSGRRRRKERKEGPDSPFPSIRIEDEQEFFSPRRVSPPPAQQRPASRAANRSREADTTHRAADRTHVSADETVRSILVDGNVPPQTVLARVIRELEDDFAHYKKLYCELADQYKVLDAASVVHKRHVLAEHLKEVIDTLEQKADQIAALYSLLKYEDRPVSPTAGARRSHTHKSVRDLWRNVRESLTEDARARLEADGLYRK